MSDEAIQWSSWLRRLTQTFLRPSSVTQTIPYTKSYPHSDQISIPCANVDMLYSSP